MPPTYLRCHRILLNHILLHQTLLKDFAYRHACLSLSSTQTREEDGKHTNRYVYCVCAYIKRVISNDQAAVSGSDITSELRAVTLVPTPTKPLASMYKGLNTCNDGIHHSKNDSIHYMFLDNYVHHDL